MWETEQGLKNAVKSIKLREHKIFAVFVHPFGTFIYITVSAISDLDFIRHTDLALLAA